MRTITSSGTISTARTKTSRSLSSDTKWFGTPMSASRRISTLLIWLLTTPLPSIVPFFSPLNAVASSLYSMM